jgi:uncharacterized membrane protein
VSGTIAHARCATRASRRAGIATTAALVLHHDAARGDSFEMMMKRLVNYFLRGLVVTAPVAITLYVCWAVFTRIDGWLGLPIPGAGLVVTILIITLVGVLASNLLTQGIVSTVESALSRLPFVRLLYSSTKDLLNAFVGEKRRFDRPVIVTLSPTGGIMILGFVTRESLEHLGLAEHVAVYVPQAYNFGGNLLVLPASQVRPVAADSADLMAFIISGGVAGGSVLGAGDGSEGIVQHSR